MPLGLLGHKSAQTGSRGVAWPVRRADGRQCRVTHCWLFCVFLYLGCENHTGGRFGGVGPRSPLFAPPTRPSHGTTALPAATTAIPSFNNSLPNGTNGGTACGRQTPPNPNPPARRLYPRRVGFRTPQPPSSAAAPGPTPGTARPEAPAAWGGRARPTPGCCQPRTDDYRETVTRVRTKAEKTGRQRATGPVPGEPRRAVRASPGGCQCPPPAPRAARRRRRPPARF